MIRYRDSQRGECRETEGMWPQAEACWGPPEARIGRKDPPLQPPEGAWPLPPLDFSIAKLMLKSWLPELEGDTFMLFFSH